MNGGGYGHFTTMQVRGRAVQGFGLHLSRLADATLELFDGTLGASRVVTAILDALDAEGVDDATLRVTVREAASGVLASGGDAARLAVEVSLSPPLSHPAAPMRLTCVVHERTLPHVKHVGTFASHHYRRQALRDGFDDALFVDADGRVLEGTFWNIGFWRRGAVVWPEGPALRGTGEGLLRAGLGAVGARQEQEVIRVDALHDFDGAFIVNARGVRAVARLGGIGWKADSRGLTTQLQRVLADVAWEPLERPGGTTSDP